MSQEQFDLLDGMGLTKSQYEWLERRFDNMTAVEQLKFAGAMEILQPKDAESVIRAASQLEKFSLLLGAGDDAALGQFVLDTFHAAPRQALPYLDAERAGRMYREDHCGSFQKGHFIQQEAKLDAAQPVPLTELPAMGDYAIRVKLASRSNTEGVWVGFPDCGESTAGAIPDELFLALGALHVKTAGECIALDADCRFSPLEDILEQYDNAGDLIQHAAALGYLWGEQGQGQPHFLEKWQAVMELEGCTRLDYALDLAQNLSCYEFIPTGVDIPSPKAEPFKVWLAQVGRERIEETIDPELTIERALETYLKKGYTREWINQRLQAIQVRKELTDEWDARGVQKGIEYAILTDEISRAWSGMSTRQYKNLKGLTKENLRDNMTTLELVLNMLAEATTTEISKQRAPETFSENVEVARAGGKVAGDARKAVEAQTSVPVITAKNAAQLNRVVSDMIEGVALDAVHNKQEEP